MPLPAENGRSTAHSDELQDIIGRVPSRVVLYGTVVITAVLILVLAGAWFIPYPDTIKVPVVLSSIDPPVQLSGGTGGQYSVIGKLPPELSGKVRPGQTVLIRLPEYPYEEFGQIPAHVEKLGSLALNGVYTVQMTLDQGLLSTRNRIIQRRPIMTGMAEIVTSNKSLLHRIFNF
jgi:hypothetical protein